MFFQIFLQEAFFSFSKTTTWD